MKYPVKEQSNIQMEFWNTSYSLWSNLTISNASVSNSGTFECIARRHSQEPISLNKELIVRPVSKPYIKEHLDFKLREEIEMGQEFSLKCGSKITGDPKPFIGIIF